MGKENTMRRITIISAVLITLLCLSVALANPIVPGYINELFFGAGSWVIEMDTYLPSETLDGWTLSSRTGTMPFKPGIHVGNGLYTLVTPDSLVIPLAIDPAGDSITVNGPSPGDHYSLIFGKGPECAVLAPAPGWSISYGGFFFLDRSPTLGAHNDTTGAMATVSGVLLDSATHAPLSGAWVEEWVSNSQITTSDSGNFRLRLLAHNLWLAASLTGYHPAKVVLSLVPGQTIDTIVYLSRVTSIRQSVVPHDILLLQSYPNPFNPSTNIAFELPAAGRVTLEIYDALGREIAELVRGFRTQGEYRVVWNGMDENGISVGSGIYLARILVSEANGKITNEKTIKLLLVR